MDDQRGYHHGDLRAALLAAAEAELAEKVTDAVKPAVAAFAARLADAALAWEPAAINQALKDTLGEFGLKMPALAIPVRLLVCGRAQTPSVDAVLAAFERDVVVARLKNV